MKFGDNLKNIRKMKKISQEELAEKLGVSRQSISKWETGENYPSMTNIMCLCTIFNCKINELVHENMVDIDSLDEEIKMNVVKFKKNEQKKMKAISKGLYVAGRIGEVCARIGLGVAIFFSICTLVFVSSAKIDKVKNEITIFNTKVGYKVEEDKISYTQKGKEIVLVDNLKIGEIDTINKIIEASKGLQITVVVLFSISLIASLIILIKLISYIEKLFKNIHDEDTPFSMDNVSYIRNIAILIVAYLLVEDIFGGLAELISSLNFNIEVNLSNYLIALIVLALSYVFKYGYEIQLDSKGKIYGDINE